MSAEKPAFADSDEILSNQADADMREQTFSQQRKRILDLNNDAARWFQSQLFDISGGKTFAFLTERNIGRETAESFCLGYAPEGGIHLVNTMRELGYSDEEIIRAGLAVRGDNADVIYDRFRDRLIFPIQDSQGEVLGFSGRSLANGKEPIYLNSPDTIVFSKQSALYGIYQAKDSKRGFLLLVEGVIDVVTLNALGIDNAVTCVGASLTSEHAKLISRYTRQVILFYDNDSAGRKAAKRAIEILKGNGLSVFVLDMHDGTILTHNRG